MLPILLLGALAGTAAAETSVRNGAFTAGEGERPAAWTPEKWSDRAATAFEWRHEGPGLGVAIVRNTEPNDARWSQTIQVVPNTWYRLSGMLRAIGVRGPGFGASLSPYEGFDRGREIKGEDSGWQRVESWFKTRPDQQTVTIACRLGSFGSLSTGEAQCTGIELSPQGGPPLNADYVYGPIEESTTPVGLPASLLIAGLVAWAAWRYGRLPPGLPLRERLAFDGILLALLAAKVLVAPHFQYRIDIGAYSAWAMKLAAEGPARFYAPGYFADYPPGYMYVLWWIGLAARRLALGTAGFVTLLKLPALLADLAVARMIFRKLRPTGARLAWTGALAFAANPALVLDSAVWGQTDSVLALLVLVAFLAQGEGLFEVAWVFAALAVLTKPQALLLVPLLVLWPVGWWSGGRAIAALLAALATVFVVADPFRGDRPWRWLIELYGGTAGYYSETAVNAMNLPALLFGMRRPDATVVLGLSAQTWGWIIGGAVGIAFLAAYLRRPTRWAYTSLFASATLVAFLCLTRMHERYLYPFFPFAALLGMRGPIGILYGLLSALFFANELVVYLFQKEASSGPDWVWMSVSAASVACLVGWLASMWRVATGRDPAPSEAAFADDDAHWARSQARAAAAFAVPGAGLAASSGRPGDSEAPAVADDSLSGPVPPWRTIELVGLALLTLAAGWVRFHDLGTPGEIVFDEVYFVEQGRNYIKGQDFMDPHPPLAKLGIALGILMFGDVPVGWRAVNALVGTALVPLMYLLGRVLFRSPVAAALAGIFAATDGLLLVDSRTAVIDIQYVTWAVAAYVLLLHMIRSGRLQDTRRLVLLGVLIGLSVAAKLYIPFFSFLLVLGTLALAARAAAQEIGAPLLPWVARPVLVVGAVASVVYALAFAPHFLWGWWHSPLDLIKYVLIKVPEYQAAVKDMTHPYSSKWWTWPLMLRPVWYYWKDPAAQAGTVAGIWGAGNPPAWWASVPALLVAAWVAFRERKAVPAFIVAGWLIHLAPWVWIGRTLFLYHYLPSLLFAMLALAWLLDRVWHGRGSVAERGFAGVALLASLLPACMNVAPAWATIAFLAALVAYEGIVFSGRSDPASVGRIAVLAWSVATLAVAWYLSPIWLGTPIAKAAWQARMWISNTGIMNWI